MIGTIISAIWSFLSAWRWTKASVWRMSTTWTMGCGVWNRFGRHTRVCAVEGAPPCSMCDQCATLRAIVVCIPMYMMSLQQRCSCAFMVVFFLGLRNCVARFASACVQLLFLSWAHIYGTLLCRDVPRVIQMSWLVAAFHARFFQNGWMRTNSTPARSIYIM